MITSYRKAKDDVLKCYNDFLKIIEQSSIPKDDRSLVALENQATKIKEDKFCLMIAGEAKSGKSTFINAYLGTEILPMDVKQCTSSVVEIRYGTEFKLWATYADGQEEVISGENNIKNFLIENAALDDEYRDIPVTTINEEIIVKYKDDTHIDAVIQDLLKGVEKENIHRLPQDEYNRKIKNYIKMKQPNWRKVVVKIEIQYPFKDENMHGISIVDSPGVNAAGRVGDSTAKYIESADAIMFLRPITGVAIEANSFKEFLESKSVDRNKNAMFLILTRAAAESDDNIERAYGEFIKMFGTQKKDARHGIVKEQIIHIDSKAELYHNHFKNIQTEEIKKQIGALNAEKKMEPFLKLAWVDADNNKDAFLKELKRYSNFDAINQALNRFGHRAQFLALSEFLGRMQRVYDKITAQLKDNIKNYELKAKDPAKLALQIAETQKDLTKLSNKMNSTVDDIRKKYASSTNGIIGKKTTEVSNNYLKEIDKINAGDDSSLDKLEKITFQYIDTLKSFEEDLQKNIVAECNKALITLSDENAIEYSILEPDFSKELFEEIKEKNKKDSYERKPYDTGGCFSKTEYKSVFSQSKYFNNVKKNIEERFDSIKDEVRQDLQNFAYETAVVYTKELANNINIKQDELTKIKQEKKSAEEIYEILNELKELQKSIEPQKANVSELKGGIDGYYSA